MLQRYDLENLGQDHEVLHSLLHTITQREIKGKIFITDSLKTQQTKAA